MKSKRGVSTVVATVLIILITVAAVGIIWAAVMPMVRNSIDKGSACFDAGSDISLVSDAGYTCITADGNISIQVRKGPSSEFELVGVQVIVSDDSGNSVSQIIEGDEMPGNNEEGVIHYPELLPNAEKVKIAPIVTVGKTEETCEPSNEVILSACKED